jgi:hypothetical protein
MRVFYITGAHPSIPTHRYILGGGGIDGDEDFEDSEWSSAIISVVIIINNILLHVRKSLLQVA